MAGDLHPNASFWFDVVDRAAKVAAVDVAGTWAYWNHRQKRTYQARLQLEVTLERLNRRERIFAAELKAQNIGNARVMLGTTRICELSFISLDLAPLHTEVFQVFQREQVIEPGERIDELLLVRLELPAGASILRPQFALDAGSNGEVRWRSDSILTLFPETSDDSSAFV